MKQKGWIKIHREILDNPIVMKDGDHLAVWIWLLLHATSKRTSVMFAGKQRYLKPGELTTGRKTIASELLISESKVQRILKSFENEHQIEQLTDFRCRLISILNWNKYQKSEQVNERQVNRFRTAGEQLVNTKQEGKEGKKEREYPHAPSFEEVREYVNEKGYNIDPEAFFDYYEETGWTKKNGQPIKDWRASIRTWARREREFNKTGKYGNGSSPVIEPPKYKEFKPDPKVDAVEMPEEIRQAVNKFLR